MRKKKKKKIAQQSQLVLTDVPSMSTDTGTTDINEYEHMLKQNILTSTLIVVLILK